MVHEEEAEVLVDTAGVDDDEEVEDDGDNDDDDDEEEEPVAVSAVKRQEKAVDEDQHDDEESLMDAEDPTENNENADEDNNENADEDDETQATEEDAASQYSLKTPAKTGTRVGKKRTPTRASVGDSSTKKRAPSVKGLTIPFRTVKKAMKLDPDIPIVQNEAAIMTTMAAELFLKSLAKQSHRNAKNRGRNTIRYEDVAEARTNSSALAFLETLLP
jgi:histone H3/H4